MSSFKVLSVSAEQNTMVIDWGNVTLNHFIPLPILEQPNLSTVEVANLIEAMRPETPQATELPNVLFELVKQSASPITVELLCQQIDQAADAARWAVAGDPLRATEYDRAQQEAQAFATANYQGEVPPMVAAWAINGRTAQQAADSILAEAAQYNAALVQLRTVRLAAKEQVRAAMQAGNTEQAQTIAEQTIAAIQAAVAGIGNNSEA